MLLANVLFWKGTAKDNKNKIRNKDKKTGFGTLSAPADCYIIWSVI